MSHQISLIFMQTDFISYLRKLAFFTFFVFLLILGYNHLLPLKYVSPHVWYVLVFFILSSALLQRVFININKHKPQLFVGYYLASIVIKLFIYLLIIIIYSFLNRDNSLSFMLSFLFLYFLYSAFEVSASINYFRRK